MLYWLFLHRHEMLTVIVIGIPERITLRLCEQRGHGRDFFVALSVNGWRGFAGLTANATPPRSAHVASMAALIHLFILYVVILYR